jgi:hypothetical protein
VACKYSLPSRSDLIVTLYGLLLTASFDRLEVLLFEGFGLFRRERTNIRTNDGVSDILSLSKIYTNLMVTTQYARENPELSFQQIDSGTTTQ